MNFFEKLFFRSIDRKLDLILSKLEIVLANDTAIIEQLTAATAALNEANGRLDAIAADEAVLLAKIQELTDIINSGEPSQELKDASAAVSAAAEAVRAHAGAVDDALPAP